MISATLRIAIEDGSKDTVYVGHPRAIRLSAFDAALHEIVEALAQEVPTITCENAAAAEEYRFSISEKASPFHRRRFAELLASSSYVHTNGHSRHATAQV